MSLRFHSTVALFFALLLPLCLVADEAEAPLTLKDIGRLRLERKSHDQILALAKKRGLAFQVDKAAAATLRSLQFRPDDIELLTRIADGSYEREMKKEAGDEPPPEADAPQAPKPGAAPPGVFVGPRLSDAVHDAIRNRTARIHEDAKTNTKIHAAETVTLVASDKTARTHLPNLKKLETQLRKRFGDPVKTGTDKRSATIVLLDNRYDYERWVKTMFAIYEKDGIRFSNPDALAFALKGPVFLTPTMTVADMSAITPQQAEHQPVFCLGYLYAAQLMEGKSPDAVLNGMGNLCEVELFGSPFIRMNSYAMREINAQPQQWLAVVRDRLKKKELASIDKILRYSTASMESHEYCEAWSLTQFLASSPELFNRWIIAVRDGVDNEKPLDALLRIYGKTEKELTAQWHRFIAK